MRYAANLNFLFTDLPWASRPAAAAAAGADLVEFPWPPLPEDEVVTVLRTAGIGVALLNMAAGDVDAGERGYPNDPARVPEWRQMLTRAVRLAQRVGAPLVNVLAGIATEADTGWDCLVANLRWALPVARAHGVDLVVEPINTRDVPGYLVPDSTGFARLVGQVPGLGLQLDVHHALLMGENPAEVVHRFGRTVRHVQVCDHPGRHEPGTGSADLPGLLRALRETDYPGALGLEYEPTTDPATSLAGAADHLRRIG